MGYFAVQDVVDHLISASGGGAQDAEQREIRSAVHHAYRDLVAARDWAWHVTQARILLEPPQTVAVTIGGGGRTLTGASGAWPANATSYRAYSSDVVAQVAERTSDTVLTLQESMRFPSSYDGVGKQVILYRNTYQLPADFRNMDALITQNRTSLTAYISPAEWARVERSVLLSGDPVYWTIMRDEATPDRWVVRVLGYPDAERTLDYTYRRKPDGPRYTGYEAVVRAGTAACSATTAVTGTSTQFRPDMAGCVFRIIDSATDHPEPLSGLYPYQEQAIIASVAGPTALTLDTALTGTYSGKKYVITSSLDLSDGMYSALLAGAEMWLARMRKGDVDKATAIYMRAMRLAMENDQLAPISGRRSAVFGSPEVSYATAIKLASISPDNG